MVPAFQKSMLFFWALLLAACTIQLAPTYDQALFDGLDQTNTATHTLFASLEDGVPASGYPDYDPRYADLIGRFDALRQRALTRQTPPLAARLAKLHIVESFCHSQDNPTECINASPASLQAVLDLLRRMRAQHKAKGLPSDVVTVFRDSYNVAITQALTVENALDR